MTKRLTALGVLPGLVLGALVLTGPAADAAWHDAMQIHGGKLQVCKVPLDGGRTRVKVRLDNRGASHAHLGGITRVRGDDQVQRNLRAAAGRLSDVKSLVLRRGDQLGAGMGETTGEGAGGELPLSTVSRC